MCGTRAEPHLTKQKNRDMGAGNKFGFTVANTVSMAIALAVWIWTVFVYIDGKIDRLDDRIDQIAVSQARVEGLIEGYFSLEKGVDGRNAAALPGLGAGELTDDSIAQRK